uniref:Serpin domain-containing protein n=1 Tax=Leersia perrieri TaxID=77586 RepID=A0A0D9XQG1_9ORYZ
MCNTAGSSPAARRRSPSASPSGSRPANPDSNVVFSPLSIHAALSLLAASAGGATLDEILAVLGAPSRDELAAFASYMATTALADKSAFGGPLVAFASGVWCDAARPLKPSYRDAVVGNYKAKAATVDFKNKAAEAADQINEWIRHATKGLIDGVMSPGSIGAATAVVLGSAIYFKGKWEHPFNESHTQTKPFYRHDGVAVAGVPYMTSRSHQYIAVHDGFRVLKLQYKQKSRTVISTFGDNTQYSMVIFLPDVDGTRHGLRRLVRRIASRPGFLREHMPTTSVLVNQFMVPKFKACCGGSVGGVLEQEGIRRPFSPELADLSGMVEDDGTGFPVFVSDVVHKAVIEVNEEGSVAAAVTMMNAVSTCAAIPWTMPVDFVADHPFVYFIVEETSHVVVFAGQIQSHRGAAVSDGQAAFAVGLVEQITAANLDRNLVFSPVSIHAALSLPAAGAVGATRDEILSVLGAASLDDLAAFASHMATTVMADRSSSGGPAVSFASGVWCDAARPLKPAYRDAVVGAYKAEATTVDFKNKAEEAIDQINEWTRKTTRDLIDSIAGSVDAATVVVLCNAIYFKGRWNRRPFKPEDTETNRFYRLDGVVLHDVPYMSTRSSQRVAAHRGFKVLKLGYESTPKLLHDDGNNKRKRDDDGRHDSTTRYAMVVFLPNARRGLPGLVKKIASRPGFLHEHMPRGREVPIGEFLLPKFKVSYGGSVVGVLEHLGLRRPFSPELADLSDMVEEEDGMPLFVSDALHKAVIEVNEEGTEAAAVTMGYGKGSPRPPKRVDFVADHPFAYFLVEEVSGIVVLAGHAVGWPARKSPVFSRRCRSGTAATPPRKAISTACNRGSATAHHKSEVVNDRMERHHAVSAGQAALGVRLAEQLAAASLDSNVVFSPLSIHAALSLLAAGACGATLDELLAVLGAASRDDLAAFASHMATTALADRSSSGGPRVAFACGVWCDAARPLERAYRDDVVRNYNAEADTVDFQYEVGCIDLQFPKSNQYFVTLTHRSWFLSMQAEGARKQINKWTRGTTRGLIDSVLPPGSVNALTTLVLGTAVYFKGKWACPFKTEYTENKPFYRLDGVVVDDVPFMSSGSKQYIAVHDGFKVLKLKYKSAKLRNKCKRGGGGGGDDAGSFAQQYAMVVFLPDKRDGLRWFVEKIASRSGFLHDHTPSELVPVGDFRFPKFKLSYGASVVGVLKQMGLRLPFSPELADLSDMVEDDGSGLPLFGSDVLHKAVIEVNEEGTEAAAVTMMSVTVGCAPRPVTVDFVADHPFAYFLVEEVSRTVVFAGHLLGEEQLNVLGELLARLPDGHLGNVGDHRHVARRCLGARALCHHVNYRGGDGLRVAPHVKLLIQTLRHPLGPPAAVLAGARRPVRHGGGYDHGSGLPLFVSDVLHKAVIEVNEEGTVAVAVTMAGLRVLCARRTVKVDFVADHPFAYFLVEEVSRAVVFQILNIRRRRAVSGGQATLAVRLTERLAAENLGRNLVFSPLSIHAALSLLAVLGAASLDDLAAFASYMATTALADKSVSGGPLVAFGSGVWCDAARPLKPAYRDAVVGQYKAEATTVDFKNKQGSRSTNGRSRPRRSKGLVDSILSPRTVNELTSLVLGNAIYFKGNWASPFKAKNTQKKPFYRLDDGVVDDVPFMSSKSYQHVAVHDGFKVLELQYKMPLSNYSYSSLSSHVDYDYTSYSMLVFLPDARDGLRGLVERIASRPGFVHEHMPHESVPVGEFRVPKFKVSFGDSFVRVLGQLGLRLPFSMELADLSGMVEDDGSGLPLFVSDVLHKAVIEVNEEGSVAAASTMMYMSLGCAMTPPSPPPPVDFVADHPFAYFIVEHSSRAIVFAGHAALAVRLTERLAEANLDRNLVFSPLSIHAALSLLAAGAAGATLDQLLAVLGAASLDDLGAFSSYMATTALADKSASGGPLVAFASGVWCDAARPLKAAYRDAVVGEYKAEATTVDFKNKSEEAREQINEWTRQTTEGLIDSILPPQSVNALTALVLGNAVYFKGNWVSPFKAKNTQKKPFYRLDGGVVDDVPFMSSKSYQYVAVHDGFKVLQLRYEWPAPCNFDYSGDVDYTSYSMLVFLPDARDGLRGLVERIASRPGFVHEHMPHESVPVGEFRVPKFKVSFGDSFVRVLGQLGLRLPFSTELADLSGMVEDGMPLYVSDVLHKAVIEVNEEGTEAAAATMIYAMPGCAMMPPPPPPPVDFVADHPFAYFIVEHTSRAIVFAGHVIDPSFE